jgi:transcriptional regulator with XRE-family HTH domain
MQQTIGRRIAQLRQQNNWTQEQLAEKVAISRVAVSHMELDLTVPGERTITLLAGLFKCAPHELVAGTTYPQAKAERLPAHTCCYTELELQLALLTNDLAWLDWLRQEAGARPTVQMATEIKQRWRSRLHAWRRHYAGQPEMAAIEAAITRLHQIAGIP